jgi:hypothetical protein
MHDKKSDSSGVSRRDFVRTGLTVAGSLALPAGFVARALADDHPAVGTWPAGVSGSTVFIGITVPQTGTYAVQGEDELKGYELAVEHINAGHRLSDRCVLPVDLDHHHRSSGVGKTTYDRERMAMRGRPA